MTDGKVEKPMKREPGYYYTRTDERWDVALWSSALGYWRLPWKVIQTHDSDFSEIGPRVPTLKEVERLRAKLAAAVSLIQCGGRITWGYNMDEKRMVYYLDGKYAGPNLDDVVTMAATAAGGSE